VASAIALLVGLSELATPAALARSRPVPGVDVSMWQDVIDWPRVHPDRVRFAIIRATKGRAFVDPTYVTNVGGAAAAGIVVGAYHRATPGPGPNDALAEADHFVSVARNASGDVLPALDIEETGGLTPSELQAWVRTWVERVRAKLGIRSLLYASPSFWRVKMGNSTWFARHGYPLWIAHWGVAAPDVPANGWAGEGWTYWQWTSKGRLAGISTEVDRDRLNGSDLNGGTIASLTVRPTPGGSVAGTRISCGEGATKCSRLANPGDVVALRATSAPDASLLRWTGVCSSIGASSECDVVMAGSRRTSAVFGYPVTVTFGGSGAGSVISEPSGLDCTETCSLVVPAGTSLALTATPDSASGFGRWGGACSGSSTTCVVQVDGGTSVTARFDASQQLEEEGAGTSFTWGARSDARAIGGSYRWDRRAGASLAFPFQGPAVSLITISGPAMGKARVWIDAEVADTVDGYAPTLRGGDVHRFGGLGAGDHVLRVVVTGTSSPRATGTRVGVDAVRWGGRTLGDPIPSAVTWGRLEDPGVSGGNYVVSGVAGASTRLRFTGTGVTWLTLRGPSMGRAEIWVDGSLVRTVDLYAPKPQTGVQRTVSGLTDDRHIVKVVVLGRSRQASSGTDVAVDGWIVR
jgi:lysozyme